MREEERVAEILGAWHEAQDRGELVEPDDVVARHPDLADELREHFEILGVIDRVLSDPGAGLQAPSTVGGYRLVREIGSGGMGTVYLAEATRKTSRLERDTKVALKIVHPHLLKTPGFFKRFQREAEAGRAVRHPNVVRTLDGDMLVVDDQPYCFLVMEYVEGRTLRELLTELGRVPEALLRELALQITAGLSAIHAAGIVHRDIKPENVLITGDHQVRIMDLGVAKMEAATVPLTGEGQFAGSLMYASPEQIRQQAVGPTADLYALGVTLYELATGSNPFRSDDPAAVLHAHLEEVPQKPQECDPDLSLFFSEVVAALLAKEPGERFASAQALERVLQEAELASWWSERQRVLERDVPRLPRIPVRRETKLHGRETDLTLLHEAWEGAKRGDGNSVLLEGEAGIGKTRVVDAFLQGLDGRDAHVLYGSYPPSGGLGGISDAIFGHFGAGDLEERLRPYLTVTPSLVPALAAVIRHESPPPGAQPLLGDALHAVCVQLMRSLATERPLLWVIEDLHFAAKETRTLALALARAVEGHRVLLVLTTRPALSEEEIAHFSRLENFRRTALGRLSAREVVLLLQDAFKSEALADKLGARIALKSDGVPFFVFEMIRGLKEGQFIEELPDGTYVESRIIEEIEVPSAVRDLIEARLRGLAREDRAVLDTGSVLGFEFDPDLVARVRKLPRMQVLEVLGDIERRSGVVRASGSHYRFDHHQIQEVIYADLSQGLREEYHTLLAEAFAGRVQGERSGDDDVFLASHHLRGSRPGDGLPHLIPALEHLENSFRNEAAIELAVRALEAPKLLAGSERVGVLLNKASRHILRGERQPARSALDEALALADESGDAALRAMVRVKLGWQLIQASDYAAAQECSAQALDLARAAGDRRAEANATRNLGSVFWRQGRFEEARAQYEKGLALAGETADRKAEAAATGNLGTVFWSQGRDEEARAQYEKCLAFAREIGDRKAEADVTGNLGNVFADQGRHEEARAQYEKHLALACEIGDRRGEAVATGHLALVIERLGRYGEACAQHEKGLALMREIGDRQGEGIALVNLGPLQAVLGQSDLARETLTESLRVLREIGARRPEGYALQGLGSVAEQRGDLEEAHRFWEDALTLRREVSYTIGVSFTLLELGRLEATQGDERAATAHIEEAVGLAEELKSPNLTLSATVERARLPGGDIRAALDALREHEERVWPVERVNARFRLWELTRDMAHLAEAKRLLDFAVDHAPEDCRESMIENVPLHRDIMRAWEEQQGQS